MKKNGFTLLELMIVVVVVAIIGVSATISFSTVEGDSSRTELENRYAEIQKAASLYVDLHSSQMDWLIENGELYIKIRDLKSENYISPDLSNPITGGKIDPNYYVKLYLAKDPKTCNTYINTCIVNRYYNTGTTGYCIADSEGHNKDTAKGNNTGSDYINCCPVVTECD